MLRITFWGAAQTVTGSRFVVDAAGRRLLVDCGLFQGIKSLRERNWQPFPVDPASAIIGAAAGYLVLWLVYWAFKLMTGKEGMGYGDFKLLAAFGAWMGWQMLPLVILLSAATGAVTGVALVLLRRRERGKSMPFGPFLAVAGWIAMMWGPEFVDYYLRYTGFA